MKSSAEYYNAALSSVKAHHEQQEIASQSHLNALYAELPELRELDCAIKSVFTSATRSMLSGGNVNFSEITEKSLDIQRQRRELLEKHGISEQSLQPDYNCKKCSDTGYYNGKMCDCVRKIATKLIYDELNRDVPLDKCTFERFSVAAYPSEKNRHGIVPRDIMEKILGFCRRYTDEFTPSSQSLLFFGQTGLGKTHLSLSIANEVIKKGYNVVYGSISRVLQSIESEYFSKGGTSGGHTLGNVIDCDLLILDDLGTEFTTPFITSTIYDIINSRILSGKPVIINTNLDFTELEKKYTPRLVSRISGCYKLFQFFGEDIRTSI